MAKTKRTINLPKNSNRTPLYMEDVADYQKMVESFIAGNWPIKPLPTYFETDAMKATSLRDRVTLLVNIIEVSLDPNLIESMFSNTDWKKEEKKLEQNDKRKFRNKKVQLPKLTEYSIKHKGEIVRAIEAAFRTAKTDTESDDESAHIRAKILKFALAHKIDEIKDALESTLSGERKLKSRWKNELYGANTYRTKSLFFAPLTDARYRHEMTHNCAIILGDTTSNELPTLNHDATTNAYTVDNAKQSYTGFVSASAHYCVEEINSDQSKPITSDNSIGNNEINSTLKHSTRHAVRLLSSLPQQLSEYDKENIEKILKSFVLEIEYTLKAKTKNHPAPIALLAYRTFLVDGKLRVIGFNIGNSTLIGINSTTGKVTTIAECREYKKNEQVTFPSEYSKETSISYVDFIIDNPDAIIISLSHDVVAAIGPTQPHEEKKRDVREYISYTLHTNAIRLIQDNLPKEERLTAKMCAIAIQKVHKQSLETEDTKVPKHLDSLSISCMQIPRNQHIVLPRKTKPTFTPPEADERIDIIRCFLKTELNGTEHKSGSYALCVEHLMGYGLTDLSDFASFLTAQLRANKPPIDTSKIQFSLDHMNKTFLLDGKQTDWLKKDAKSEMNRNIASKLFSCVNELLSVLPSKEEKLHQIAAAGVLGKNIIPCKNSDDYRAWLHEANHVHDNLKIGSKLRGVLDQCLKILADEIQLSSSNGTAHNGKYNLTLRC